MTAQAPSQSPRPPVTPLLPEPGQVVQVRGSTWAVTGVAPQGLLRSPADEDPASHAGLQHEVRLINAWIASSMTSTPVARRTQRRTDARVTSGTLRPRRATAPAMQTAPGSYS